MEKKKILGINGEVIGFAWSEEMIASDKPILSAPAYAYDKDDNYLGEIEGALVGNLE